MKLYKASLASLSWIDQRTGLPEVDKVAPRETITRAEITGNSGYRFSSFLDVSVEFDENSEWKNAAIKILPQTGIYRAPSFLHIPSSAFPVNVYETKQDPIVIRQVTGARTISPEVIGTGAGVAGGAALGAAAGVWFFGIGALPGAGIGALIGGLGGEVAAHQITGFPPIWSEIQISIYQDGRITYELLRHSLFPSLTFYTPDSNQADLYKRTPVNAAGSTYYDGMPNLERWQAEGWGTLPEDSVSGPTRGNPWGDFKGVF